MFTAATSHTIGVWHTLGLSGPKTFEEAWVAFTDYLNLKILKKVSQNDLNNLEYHVPFDGYGVVQLKDMTFCALSFTLHIPEVGETGILNHFKSISEHF